MKVDFESPEFIARMVNAQLTHIKFLKDQISEDVAICKQWLEMLENLDGQEKLLQELKSRLEEHG